MVTYENQQLKFRKKTSNAVLDWLHSNNHLQTVLNCMQKWLKYNRKSILTQLKLKLLAKSHFIISYLDMNFF